MTLLTLKNGESCRLAQVNTGASCYDRLMELGFVAGEEVRVLRRAPLGGPLQVQVRDTCYAIRRSDAKHISIMK